MIPLREELNPHFVMYYLASTQAKQFIFRNVKGVAQQGINLRDLRELPTPSPSPVEQEKAVCRIEAAFAWVDKIAN
jgi:type I restriction enzyme S subunit